MSLNCKKVPGNLFPYCTQISTITLGNNVETICENGCSISTSKNLYSIDIPNSVTLIGNEAFSGCSNLSVAYIGTGVTSIGKRAFAETKLVHIYYRGTMAQWESIEKGENWSSNLSYQMHYNYKG